MVTELIPPQDDPVEAGFYAAFRGIIGVVDLSSTGISLNGPLGEAFNFLFKPSYDRKLKVWFDDMARQVITHMQQIGQLEGELRRLQSDERFLSTLVTAARTVAATHAAEKLEALRNAVVNMAAGINVDEIERQLFLRYIDELTEMHLRILKYGNGAERPKELSYGRLLDGSSQTVLTIIYPELTQRPGLAARLWTDLAGRGLVIPIGASERLTASKWRDPWTTELGAEFLRFISAPMQPTTTAAE